ncbi:substrate-binding domain-containing protein [Dactylosporangium fulvum]|uniref:VWA domain-containing protein n=1 Tax=Dactylosporangium fulvum TaxID=53359 RepID=A0ABY5W8E5_9ACTN|nr:VWA domain-containing protein [Dactylosporangium fulvum]UWP86147.1 VWA domain-containing protein [Dactylosporangium fulvum]
MRRWNWTAPLLVLTLAAAGCTGDEKPPQAGEGPYLKGDGVLRVLAGSELADLQPVLDAAAAATGVTVKLSGTGTLEGVEAVVNGTAAEHYDAIWFASNRYLQLHPGAGNRIGTATKVAASPVVLGLRRSVADKLGWNEHRPTWSEIAVAAGEHRFSYGMTNPASSNSGFSALVGVAAALAGTGAALDADQIAPLTPRLRAFFAGQQLTSGSSGWLADAYLQSFQQGQPVDGLVNYESVILSLNASGKLPEPLTAVYPADGAVTADYPLTLLAGPSVAEQAKTNYAAVVDYLRRPSVQRQIMERTWRRPAVPDLALAPEFGPKRGALPELPFPGRLAAADALIGAFGDSLRKPARTIYVLDLSGSMKGERLQGLRSALVGLTGADNSLAGQFTRFNGREQVLMLPFSTKPGQTRRFDVPEGDFQPTLDQIRAYAGGLNAGGDTAIYDALLAAYEQAAPLITAEPDRHTSIVLLTDGERTTGADLAAFQARLPRLPRIPVFTILFGEGNVAEMQQIATVTGGRSFDARTGALAGAFKEIRGYQ